MSSHQNFQPVIQRFKLNESIIKNLKDLTPNFGFNGLGELVFRRTYSRNNEDWCDVVIRVVEGCLSIRKEHFVRSSLLWEDEKWQTFASNMALSLFNMEWLPPGRGLWMMGTDFTYKRGSMSLNNCFQVQTKFWTSEGLKSFSDFKDGDSVVVRGKNKWVPATVKCFGQAPLWKLTVGKSGIQNTIFVTANHRWITRKLGTYVEEIQTTEELIPGYDFVSFEKGNSEYDTQLPLDENSSWRVIDSGQTSLFEDVWCVVEPEFEEFTLENGILTKNCSATDTEDDFVHSAEWTMDGLMNGVGVGFTTNWRGEATMPDKKDSEIFVIPDSREGWVESLIKLMCSYINSPRYGKNKFPIFDYSQIRAHGEPIKGFGGTASGFDPLKQMHERIESYLDAFCVGRLQCTSKTWKEFKSEDLEQATSEWREVEVEVDKPYSHTRLVADVFNAIGACVVAGNVRRCLPSDALVHTKGGLIPIKDVEIGQEALTFNGYQKITNKFVQGVQKLVKIITQDGDFRCTPDHKMAILNRIGEYKMTKTCDIKPGDRMISPRIAVEGNEDVKMPCFVNATIRDKINISIPNLDQDMSWLIGVYQGDGCVKQDSAVCVRLGEENIANKIKEQFQRFSPGMTVTISKIEDKNCFNINASSKQLCYFFKTYIKQSNTCIKIPEFIWKTTLQNRLSYITGLMDSDGSTQHRPVIVLSTIYESFAREVQNLLYSCGLESRLKLNRKQSGPWSDKPYHEVCLISHHSKNIIEDVSSLNKELRIGTRSQNCNGFPMNWLPESVPYSQRQHYSKNCSQLTTDTYERVFCQKLSYTPVEVIEVVEDVEEETYDIEVANRHEFFCNGYLSSNSAEISLGYVDDKDFMNLKNYEINPERSAIGWLSNNSVVLRADRGYEDFSYIPELARRILDNGEPGMINLYNIQKYGRSGKELPDEATMVNPCAEIALSNWELCNLSEVFPPRCSDPQKFYKALEYATFYASTVSLLPTHRPETNAVIAKNRRIGVSISGIAQWANSDSEEWGQMNYTKMITFLRKGYKVVRETNTRLAKESGVPAAVRVTTVKPSGSISLLAGCTPGVHYPVSRYAIRRVRIGMTSPLVPSLIAAGVPHEKDIVSENTYVFEFVIDHGDVRPCEDVSPWEQFSVVQMMQKHYADNCVSATIYFDKEKDGPDLEKLLAMFIPNLKSVSMLPHSGHGYCQAPYEKISLDEYNRRKNEFKPIDYKSVKNNVPSGSKFCSGDNCEL